MIDEIDMLRGAIKKIHASILVQEDATEIILRGPNGNELGFLVDDMVTGNLINDYELPRPLRNQINGWDELPKRAILPHGITLPDFCIPKTGFYFSLNRRQALPDTLSVEEFLIMQPARLDTLTVMSIRPQRLMLKNKRTEA